MNGRARALLMLTLVAAVFIALLLSWGAGGPLPDRAIAVLVTLASSVWAPLLYLLGSLGMGRLVRRWVREIESRWVIEMGVGLTLTLSLSMLLGMNALLTPLSAWAITGLGLLLLVSERRSLRVPASIALRFDAISIVIVLGALLALVMACNPPGVLWSSEYGGFDALSYHLQLPREWIEQGRIWPSTHNVYSFLPGAIEGAYMHLALLMGGDMHTHDSRAAMSAQMLSVLMLLVGAGAIGVLCRTSIERFVPDADARLGGAFAIALTLSTPWLLVVGSIAYNETALALLGASALLIAMQSGVASWKRAIMCALIVGGACSCKPTALFMLAPSIGIVLLACTPRKHWVSSTLLCIIVGALTIAPWLVRNTIATGNPVFPQLASQLGSGHWTLLQHTIYDQAHHFDGSLLDRFALLVLPDPNGVDHVSRYRGLTNTQWGVLPTLALLGLGSLMLKPSNRRVGLIGLGVVLVPIGCWAMLTHIQSRFLVPLAPVLIVLGSMGLAQIPRVLPRRIIAGSVATLSMIWCVGIALAQYGGNPFMLLDLGPGVFMGSVEVGSRPWTAAVNELADDGDTIYLLGDATPFYVLGDVRYNTVYDRWLIQDAIDAHPDDPSMWTEPLRERGIDLVVISFSEIDRYARSGWLPGSIDPDQLIVWIESLGQPIEVWSNPDTGVPIRAVFRLDPAS